MTRILQIFLRSLLLLIALAALVLWPVSRGKWLWVTWHTFSQEGRSVHFHSRFLGCWDGRILFGRQHDQAFREPAVTSYRWSLLERGSGWRRHAGINPIPWDDPQWTWRRWPLRGNWIEGHDPDRTYVIQRAAAPCWLVALAAGAWPGASLVFAIRRAMRRRRAAREGLCKRCGYDLRATPERCPECGTVTMP